MRIAVISTPIFRCPPRGYSGLEQIAWETARGLALLGHQVMFIAPDGSECPGCQVVPNTPPDGAGRIDEKASFSGIKGTPYGGYWQALRSVDCVIDDTWQKHSMMLRLEGVLKAPVLGVLHAPVNTMFEKWPSVPLPPPKSVSYVCISNDQADHFRQLFGRECRVCHNGVDVEYYKPLNIPRSDRFLFLARLSTIKGPDIAIEACKKAGVGLDIVGDVTITQEPELARRCLEMADGEQIRFVGNQPRGACVWWFNQAHALLHPNERFREPFGLAPVEAQLCGCPVLAWDNGAMRETVENGETGTLVKSFDELVTVLKMTKNFDWVDYYGPGGNEDQDMRKHCREWAKRFSVEAMAQRYASLCQEAIDLKGGW